MTSDQIVSADAEGNVTVSDTQVIPISDLKANRDNSKAQLGIAQRQFDNDEAVLASAQGHVDVAVKAAAEALPPITPATEEILP